MHYLDYNEPRTHGTTSFPAEYYYIDEKHARYQMPYHWHKEYELLRIKEGSFRIRLDDEAIHATAGDVIFIRDGVIHGGIPEKCVYECVVFDLSALLSTTETLRRYIHQITGHRITVHAHFGEKDSKLCRAARQLFHAMARKTPGYELSAVGALYTVLSLFFELRYFNDSLPDSALSLTKTGQLKPVLAYMESNYAADISLDMLAGLAGMSAKYFCRYFRSVIHQTPIEYLNYYRIERACYALSATDTSITEIGFSCGFHDTAYFIRAFRRQKGMTPGQYRKNI